MQRSLYAGFNLLIIFILLFAFPNAALANEGEGGGRQEVEVGGYHVTLSSENEWIKGENVIVVTIADAMGMPVSDAEVEILFAPKADAHAESEMDGSHGSDPPQEPASGMDMGNDPPQEPVPGVMSAPAAETPDMPAHDEENASPTAMLESEHGMYTVETHLESSGEHDVHVMFHVDGEILQADFTVEVAGSSSKTIVLWSFVAVNVALVASAGILKKQKTITVKGA